MDNRQQLLSQYVYPGLGEDAASGESVPRAAYPHDAYPELAEPEDSPAKRTRVEGV